MYYVLISSSAQHYHSNTSMVVFIIIMLSMLTLLFSKDLWCVHCTTQNKYCVNSKTVLNFNHQRDGSQRLELATFSRKQVLISCYSLAFNPLQIGQICPTYTWHLSPALSLHFAPRHVSSNHNVELINFTLASCPPPPHFLRSVIKLVSDDSTLTKLAKLKTNNNFLN